MIQFLHDPSMIRAAYSLGLAFFGFLGLWAIALRVRADRKVDVNKPEVMLKDMYADDDVEEIVLPNTVPILVTAKQPEALTPARLTLAMMFITLVALGLWFGYRNFSIVKKWEKGEFAYANGDFPGAEQRYREALAIDPQARRSHKLLARTLLAEKKADPALNELKTAADGDRADATIHVDYADTLQAVGKYDEAIPEYRESIAISPKNAESYVRLASCLVKLNRMDDAAKEFQYASLLDPKDVKVQTNLGCLLLAKGNSEDGLSHLKRAVELDPSNASAINTLATGYAKCKLYDKAAAQFRLELAQDPEFAVGYFNLGMCLEKLGDTHGALEAYESYLRKCLTHEDARAGVGVAQEAIKKLKSGEHGSGSARRPASPAT